MTVGPGYFLTKYFTTQYKRRYKSMRWIAMSVDNAITIGIGRYPPVYAMVEWLGDLEDTLIIRSELIKLAGPRVDRDLPSHLPYRKIIEFEGRQVFVMSQTEAGLMNGEMKALQRIKGASTISATTGTSNGGMKSSLKKESEISANLEL